MTDSQDEIARRIRRRAFRSGNARDARRLLALADEVPTIRFTNAARVLQAIDPAPKCRVTLTWRPPRR